MAMCQNSAVKTSEIKELSELRETLGLNGLLMGEALYQVSKQTLASGCGLFLHSCSVILPPSPVLFNLRVNASLRETASILEDLDSQELGLCGPFLPETGGLKIVRMSARTRRIYTENPLTLDLQSTDCI